MACPLAVRINRVPLYYIYCNVLYPYSTLNNSNNVLGTWQVKKRKQCTELPNTLKNKTRRNNQSKNYFVSLQFKISVYVSILIKLCYLIYFYKMLVHISCCPWTIVCMMVTFPLAYLLIPGYLLRTPDNWIFFLFRLKVPVIGSQLYFRRRTDMQHSAQTHAIDNARRVSTNRSEPAQSETKIKLNKGKERNVYFLPSPSLPQLAPLRSINPLRVRPFQIALVKCWKVAHWNAKKLLKNCQKSKRFLPKFQKLPPKFLDIFI